MGTGAIPNFDDFVKQQPQPSAAPKIPTFDEFTAAKAAQPQATISAQPQPTSIGGKISKFASDAANDLKYGGDQTIVGRGLRAMGAQPLYNGATPQTAEYMGSIPLGGLRAVKGIGEVAQPGHRMEGAKDIASGGLQAAEIPLSFTAPEGTIGAGRAVRGLLPSAERAGQAFSEVKGAAGGIPVDLAEPGNIALNISELAKKGGSMPKVIRDFMNWTTDPKRPPLTFADARDFYSAASKLSADESMRLTPVMKRQIGMFTNSLGNSIQQAAEQAGKGETFSGAMKEYRQAKGLQDFGEAAKDVAKKAAIGTIGGGLAGYAAKRALSK